MSDTRRELLSLLERWQVDLRSDFGDDTPLISSGAIDSLTLFNLALWIEEKTGRTVDPGAVDLAASWDSVRLILAYLDGSRVAAPAQATSDPGSRRLRAADIRIVRYAPRQKEAVAELQTGLWSPDASLNRAYLEWKYEQNPYDSEPHIYLALDGTEIVGMRGFYPSRWEVGLPARGVDVLVADDFLLRADHRNEGLATWIMREALDDLRGRGIDYVFNLSGGPLTVLGSLAMGWRSVGPLERARRLTIPRRLQMALGSALRRLPFSSWGGLRRGRLPLASERKPFTHVGRSPIVHHAAGGVSVRVEPRSRPREMADLIARRGYRGRFRHLRDQTYFQWRFRDPRNEFRFFFAGSGAVEGYLVVQQTTAYGGVGPRTDIVDFEAQEPTIRSALLETAIEVGRFGELLIWTAGLDSDFTEDLKRFSFEPVDQPVLRGGNPLLVRPVDDARLQQDWLLNGVRLLDPGNWDLRMIYSMGDPSPA